MDRYKYSSSRAREQSVVNPHSPRKPTTYADIARKDQEAEAARQRARYGDVPSTSPNEVPEADLAEAWSQPSQSPGPDIYAIATGDDHLPTYGLDLTTVDGRPRQSPPADPLAAILACLKSIEADITELKQALESWLLEN